ncbi:ABC transporter substrate-binding protein [Aeromicrobium sp. CTD01-1L150]|uniref:ABC transporter substrate-binding protein n=1 Tax=Aeromicrobium sp. CTD01-1L150 TaxID=3341830 RepID=UPI0035C16C43
MSSSKLALAAVGVASLILAACGGAAGGGDDDTITFGISAPMSGDAAGWGTASKWLAEKAAQEINDAGGIEIDGENLQVEIVIQDNKYTAADGARAAQTLLSRDNVDMISFSVGTAPVQALQSLTEREEMLMMTSAWGREIKGPDFPYTFTTINTPFEVLRPLGEKVVEEEGEIESIALVGINDATGIQSEKVAKEVWTDLGVDVVSSDLYEHGTTEFSPIATKLLSTSPEAIDLTTLTPAATPLLLNALNDQGWDGITLISAGTGGAALLSNAGEAAEGVYLGLSANFGAETATEKQRELQEGLREAVGEDLNGVTIGAYDSVVALAAAIEAAGTVDNESVRDALTTTQFESSWGPAGFGGEDVYGSKQQLLTPMIVSQVRDGEYVEIDRIIPDELAELQ